LQHFFLAAGLVASGNRRSGFRSLCFRRHTCGDKLGIQPIKCGDDYRRSFAARQARLAEDLQGVFGFRKIRVVAHGLLAAN